jgi:hypothetical protein
VVDDRTSKHAEVVPRDGRPQPMSWSTGMTHPMGTVIGVANFLVVMAALAVIGVGVVWVNWRRAARRERDQSFASGAAGTGRRLSRIRRARDPRGFRRYVLVVLWPGVIAFLLLASAATSTRGTAHLVVAAFGIAAWVLVVALAIRGWHVFFRERPAK